MRSLPPSLLTSLSLPPNTTHTFHPHGSSGFSTTGKLEIHPPPHTTTPPKFYFVKIAEGKGAKRMFRGEHASLNAIADVVPDVCPRSHGWGGLEDVGDGAGSAGAASKEGGWLVTDFLEMGGRLGGRGAEGSGMSLASKLGKLHSTPAPTPEGHEKPMFGFPVPTCCGDTEQDNTLSASWAEFYGERRLRGIVRESEKRNGGDEGLKTQVERTVREVVPRLIGDEHLNKGNGVTPVVVHGDLWSGNHGRGRIDGGGWEEVVFDPSACYAHNEYELGIMRMFGGFGGGFLREYHELVPKTEPVGEYEDRVKLYELYHHLNHHAIFGGGYRSGAMSIMSNLIRKYGNKDEV